MARSGDAIEHPVTGERVVWRRVAEDTNGELLELDLFAQPGGFVAAAHVHPNQEERFEVMAGTLALRVGDDELTLGAGDVTVVPPGRPHAWWNAGPEQVRIRGQIRPALRTENFFETFFGLGRDGKTNRKGLPNLLQLAVLMREYEDEMRLAKPPFAIQRMLFAPLAIVGRILGYRSRYPHHSQAAAPQRPDAPREADSREPD
jgi:mannose-6-phosphate isomerase-like protein (cupin superfamily)